MKDQNALTYLIQGGDALGSAPVNPHPLNEVGGSIILKMKVKDK